MQTTSQGCRKSRPRNAQSVFLIILAAGLSLSSQFHGGITLPGMLHGTIFFFFLLILAQRSRLLAYLLLPLLVGIRLTFPAFYDLTGFFLHTHTFEEIISTARINQYHLRAIYEITPGACLLCATGAVILYGMIFCVRRYLRPVCLSNETWTWITAGLYISVSLFILPFGSICP